MKGTFSHFVSQLMSSSNYCLLLQITLNCLYISDRVHSPRSTYDKYLEMVGVHYPVYQDLIFIFNLSHAG